MAVANRIHHKVKNGKWVRPEMGYDAWKTLNAYAKFRGMDFPTVMDLAAGILTGEIEPMIILPRNVLFRDEYDHKN